MIQVTEEDLHDGTNGACLGCGEIIYGGVEPDARQYECESCGANRVFGLEELLVMGQIEIGDEDE